MTETKPVAQERMFTIRQDNYGRVAKHVAAHPSRIPWDIAEEAFGVYLREWGGSGTLERMEERGGFTGGEMDMFMPDWRERVSDRRRLRALAEWIRQAKAALEAAHVDGACLACTSAEDGCPLLAGADALLTGL